MRNLKFREMWLIYNFGSPELNHTTHRLRAVAMFATDNQLKRTIRNLVSYLNKDGVAERYEFLYYDIRELFSPDDDTRPPGAGALRVPERGCLMAA
jgi:hypothetical protein